MRTKQSKANREARAAGKARQVRSSALGKLLIMLAVVAAIVFGVAIFFKVNTIEVQGNSVYSADQIIEASQIQQGDNLLTVNKALAVGNIKADETLMRFAVSLDGRQLDSSGAVLDSVAGGTDLVGITLEETALKRAAAGEDIALIYPDDGTSCIPDGGALVQGAPHPENARKFLDFIAGNDVQSRLETEFSRRPVREGVESGGVLRPLEELVLVDYDLAWTVEHHDSILMSWAFYLGGGEEP